jgi:hypothetical protein
LVLVIFAQLPSTCSAQPGLTPFTPSERWSHYVHRTYAPARLGLLLADTGIDHALREPHCWDSSALSFGHRYARALERRIIKNSAELAGGLLTGEDLRYRASRSRSMSRRVWHAVTSSTIAQMPDGTIRPAYTRMAASVVSEVSTAHWTHQAIQPRWMLQSVAWSVVGQAETNLLDEFSPDLRRIGTRVWKRVRFDRSH